MTHPNKGLSSSIALLKGIRTERIRQVISEDEKRPVDDVKCT